MKVKEEEEKEKETKTKRNETKQNKTKQNKTKQQKKKPNPSLKTKKKNLSVTSKYFPKSYFKQTPNSYYTSLHYACNSQ